jgi:hypothetical protein
MTDSCDPLNPELTSCAPTNVATALALEFPDWSGHRAAPPSVTAEEMHRYNESLLRFATAVPGFEERRLAAKVRVEFVL